MTSSKPLALVVPLVALRLGVPLPRVVKLRLIGSFDTALPLPSSTAIVRIEVPPGFTVLGAALVATTEAAPAPKATLVVAVKPLTLAEVIAVSAREPARRETVATPDALVTADTAVRLPAEVEKLTTAPGTPVPLLFRAVAIRLTVLEPSAGIAAAELDSVRLEIELGLTATVMGRVRVEPLVAVATMLSIPARAPAV